MNIELRKKKSHFEKYFFKQINNTAFGETVENVKKRRDVKLVTTKARNTFLVSEQNYLTTKAIFR